MSIPTDLREFVTRIAGWTLDGEEPRSETLAAILDDDKLDGEGRYIMEGDEALDTIREWVEEARQIAADLDQPDPIPATPSAPVDPNLWALINGRLPNTPFAVSPEARDAFDALGHGSNESITATDLNNGTVWEFSRHPCGLGCRCAAKAVRVDAEGATR